MLSCYSSIVQILQLRRTSNVGRFPGHELSDRVVEPFKGELRQAMLQDILDLLEVVGFEHQTTGVVSSGANPAITCGMNES